MQSYLGTWSSPMWCSAWPLGCACWPRGLEDAGIWGVLAGCFVIPLCRPADHGGGRVLPHRCCKPALSAPPAQRSSAATVALAFAVGMVLQTWVMGKQAAINAPAMFIGVLLFGWAGAALACCLLYRYW